MAKQWLGERKMARLQGREEDFYLDEKRPQYKWVGERKMAARREQWEKDRALEQAGLLNYQNRGMSAAEIAARSTAAGQPRPQPQIQYTTADSGLVVKQQKYSWWNGAPVESVKAQPTFATMEQARAGQANWTDVSTDERRKLLSDPNFYKSGEITKYPFYVQQDILKDPAMNWNLVPKWQKPFFEISSSPKFMAIPLAIAGGVVGSALGPVGMAAGAYTGWRVGVKGVMDYNPTKSVSEQPTTEAKLIRILNVLSEYVEMYAGYTGQVSDAAISGMKGNEQAAQAAKDMLFDPAARRAAVEAGRLTYEYSDSGGRYLTNLFQLLSGEKQFAQSGQDFVLGAAGPTNKERILGHDPLTGKEKYVTDVMQVLQDARHKIRAEINAGRDPDEVVMQYLQSANIYVGSQLQDLVWQSVLDPLNILPGLGVGAGRKIADVTGNKVAAAALSQSKGLNEAARRYKTLVQTGKVFTIDPDFQVDQMGLFSRMVAGVTDKGEVRSGSLIPRNKGLLDPVTGKEWTASNPIEVVVNFVKDPVGFVKHMTEQTPHSRAQTGANLFYENISALLTSFEDPHDAYRYLKALANSDMETWAELGSRFAESPEFYTVLPALKEFNISKLEGIIQQWDLAQPNRDAMLRMANLLGQEPAKWLEDTAKRGTLEQDFQRLKERVRNNTSVEAQALKSDIEAGRITAGTLKEIVDLFTGEGALSWHPGQAKALMVDALGAHFDEWVTKRLMLDKSLEATSAFYRTTALMKQAQSILLLGGSPGYAITNGLSNIVHRAVTGIYGYMTPNQINTFLDRLGVTPARMQEGVGIGGQVEQMAGGSQVKTEAMTTAVRGKGGLTTAKDVLSKISRGMPMSRLSSWFEKVEGRQGFAIAMKQFLSQSWRRGVGFRTMRPELVNVIKEMGIAPERIYAAIEAGMNQGEIEKVLFGRYEGVQARALIHDAAQKTGLSASQAADMLEKTGALDTLDIYLKGQTTQDGVQAAFKRAERTAQDFIDMQTGEDLKASAEAVKQRVGLEGAASALDVAQKATSAYTDVWMDHYARFGEVMSDLKLLDDPDMRNRAIDYNYQLSDDEFRRLNARHAANYTGIFEAWGLSGNENALNVLAAIGESDAAMRDAYRGMRDLRRSFFDTYRGDWDNPGKWDKWDADNTTIDRLFKQGFADKHAAEVKMGRSLAAIYEGMYGPAVGEAALKWWEDVTAFNDEIVKREQDFRKGLEGLTRDQRDTAKQKYYSETKILLIDEADRINGEGIARLERVIKGGRGTGTPPTTPVPDQPPAGPAGSGQLTAEARGILTKLDEGGSMPAFITNNLRRVASENGVTITPEMNVQNVVDALRVKGQTPASDIPSVEILRARDEFDRTQVGGARNSVDEMNALLAASEQRKGAEARLAAERLSEIWDTAEAYWGRGANYNRGILQDKFALLNAMRKAEYGGIPDLKGLNDPRLTLEIVRSVLETRKAAKEIQAGEAAVSAFQQPEPTKKRNLDPNNTNLLQAIVGHGGLDIAKAKDLTGEKRPRTMPGVFTKKAFNKGWDITDMARYLADDGFAIDLNHPDDTGGVQQTRDLINRALTGDKIYPMGHDYSKALDAAEKAYIETFDFEAVPEIPFDQTLWQTEFTEAVTRGDLTKIWGMIGDVPESFDPNVLQDYVRIADETAARVEAAAAARDAQVYYRVAQDAIGEAETRAEAVTTRQLLKEKFQEVFGLDEAQATAWMELSDSVGRWYAKKTGESGDAMYARYYGDVVKGQGTVDGGRLEQAWLQRADVYQIERVRSEYKAAKRIDWAEAAVQKFGTTTDIREAGYILPDGRMLDLSGKNEGGDPGNRPYDHRDIAKVVPSQGTQALLDFTSETGSIRISDMGGDLYVDMIGTVPNDAQLRALKRVAAGYQKITFDITDSRGNTILSGDLPGKRVSVERIANEARRLFEGTESGESLQSNYDALFQEAQAERVWYSKLTQTVEAINQPRMTVEQLRGALAKAGVKADEIKWMGLDSFLEGRKNVTKEEALNFLRENQVQVEEVTKGEGRIQPPRLIERSDNPAAFDQGLRLSATINGDTRYFRTIDEANAFSASEQPTATKFGSYNLPGGENYREVLFTLPKKEAPVLADIESIDATTWKVSGDKNELRYIRKTEQGKYVVHYGDGQNQGTFNNADVAAWELSNDYTGQQVNPTGTTYKSPHWNEPNVLAHVRLDDRVDADGKRMLFVEEAQSDWHQAGREKGYKDMDIAAVHNGGQLYNIVDIKGRILEQNVIADSLTDAITVFNQDKNILDPRVPQAPFSKTWHEMVMKRVLRMAAEEGYERVGWTTGEQQAARYDLSKQVDSIEYTKFKDGSIEIDAIKDDNSLMKQTVKAPEELTGIIGKDAAQKIVDATYPINREGNIIGSLRGKDLAVGGQGMKGFYDKILPGFMDKYGKKWGAKTGETRITTEGGKSFDVYDGNHFNYSYETRAEAKKYIKSRSHLDLTYRIVEVGNDVESVHSIDVTPAMRESVMQGQPLFQDVKGAVTFDGDGIKATIHAFEARDFTTLVHENGHVFRRMLADVAERTGNEEVKADLATIEKWAGVKDGKWERAHEEKFARGFERYFAEGRAPTPALARVFESFKLWMLEIYKTITGSVIDVKITDEVRAVFDNMAAGDDAQRTQAAVGGVRYALGDVVRMRDGTQTTVLEVRADASMVLKNGRVVSPFEVSRVAAQDNMFADLGMKAGPDEVQATLFQEADQPFGAYDAASGYHPQGEALDQGWSQHVRPLLEAMQEGAIQQLGEPAKIDGAVRDMSPEGQAMLSKYMKQVINSDLPSTKLAAMRWGENQRDFALLNYNKRYGIDRLAEALYPYQFFYTRSLMTWAARTLDKPALYSNYARLRMQQDRYERDIPERLRGRIKISAPWLPEWMGGNLYIDPMTNLFFPANLLRPFERAQQDKNYQMIEAERILQEWTADGTYSESQAAQAAETQSGTVWERALAEAQIRRESEIANPFDFFSTMFGPAWYLSTPLSLAGIKVFPNQGEPGKVNTTPLYNTIRGLDTVTQGTWAEPIGNLIGMLGKPEEWLRKKLELPEFGEYGDYYIDRQLANMVAEGLLTSEQAQIAMIERQGEFFDQARERVKLEVSLRVPTMGALYAGLNEGAGAGTKAFLPSLFGSGLLPAGELEYRGLKQEWNEAWKRADMGDTTAVPAFFDKYPEYEAYLAKNKEPEERLRSFLIGQIWDGYMALGTTNKKQASAEMGDLFRQSFLDRETRSYETLDVETLTRWAQMLNKKTPAPSPALPQMSTFGEGGKTTPPKLNLYDQGVTMVTDEYFSQRAKKFPNFYEEQTGYYALPKSERSAYLLKTPGLKEYWDWKDGWYKKYPQYAPVFNGMVFKRVDTSMWPPGLVDYVISYAYTGRKLPSGAYKALEQQWIVEGMPMDDLKSWLDSVVVPAMLYGE